MSSRTFCYVILDLIRDPSQWRVYVSMRPL